MRGKRRRLRLIGAVAAVFSCATAAASAHPFGAWSGKSGPFAWQAKQVSCGSVGESPSRVQAHSRWRRSPANGYQRLTFSRQIRDDATGEWTTVQRQRRSTRNTRLEGSREILHWSQFFFPLAGEGGKTSRHVVRFEWLRDRPGPTDRLVAARVKTLRPCVVGE
jgi:hypothetical protein